MIVYVVKKQFVLDNHAPEEVIGVCSSIREVYNIIRKHIKPSIADVWTNDKFSYEQWHLDGNITGYCVLTTEEIQKIFTESIL